MMRSLFLYLSAAGWARGITMKLPVARKTARHFVAGEELNEAVAEAQVSFTKLSAVMNDLQSGKGSLGKFLKDDRLYNHALATTRNLDLLLQDFRLNPKRYVSVSVFGKKQKEYVVPDDDPAGEIEDVPEEE